MQQTVTTCSVFFLTQCGQGVVVLKLRHKHLTVAEQILQEMLLIS